MKPIANANRERPNRRDHCSLLIGGGGAAFAGTIGDTEGMKNHAATMPIAASTAKDAYAKRQAPDMNSTAGTATATPTLVPAFMTALTRPCSVRLTNACMAAVSAGIIRPVQMPQANTPAPSDSAPTDWLTNARPTTPNPPDSTAVLRAPSRSAVKGAISVASTKLTNGSAPMMPITDGASSSSARMGGTNKPKAKRASP